MHFFCLTFNFNNQEKHNLFLSSTLEKPSQFVLFIVAHICKTIADTEKALKEHFTVLQNSQYGPITSLSEVRTHKDFLLTKHFMIPRAQHVQRVFESCWIV